MDRTTTANGTMQVTGKEIEAVLNTTTTQTTTETVTGATTNTVSKTTTINSDATVPRKRPAFLSHKWDGSTLLTGLLL